MYAPGSQFRKYDSVFDITYFDKNEEVHHQAHNFEKVHRKPEGLKTPALDDSSKSYSMYSSWEISEASSRNFCNPPVLLMFI